jgi:hypothetical protein
MAEIALDAPVNDGEPGDLPARAGRRSPTRSC